MLRLGRGVMRSRASIGPKVGAGSVLSLECGNLVPRPSARAIFDPRGLG